MKFLIFFIAISTLVFAGGKRSKEVPRKVSPRPIDFEQTGQTWNLFQNLLKMKNNSILFGHQNAFKEGRGWKFNGTPDVKKVSGQLPAVVGFDFRDVIKRPNFYVDFYRNKIVDYHAKGGIITFSWHMENPVTGGSFYDKTPAIKKILPGGSKHYVLLSRLDKFAKFAKETVDSRGNPIPIIFRPWHEHNGNWFWWSFSEDDCKEFCWLPWVAREHEQKAARNFIRLWKFTVRYLRDVKKVHNLLYAYSPGIVDDRPYFWRYPGDRWVDILGVDKYEPSTSVLLPELRRIVRQAERRGKIAALTETGDEGVPNGNYWTDLFIDPIKKDPVAKKLSYILVWRNSGENNSHFFGPYPGHRSAGNFNKMVTDDYVHLLDELPMNPYSVPK